MLLFLSFRNEKIALRNFKNDMDKTSMSRIISSDVSVSIVMVKTTACNYQMEPHRFGKFLLYQFSIKLYFLELHKSVDIWIRVEKQVVSKEA